MTYTEIKSRNGRNYFYRVMSVRKGKAISKERIYLGKDLAKKNLLIKEQNADKILTFQKKKKKVGSLNKLIPKIRKILIRNKVTKAGIFGSYARGEQKKNSDIDILVKIDDKKMSLLGFVRLIRILEAATNKKVDLVEYNTIKPQIKSHVLKEEVRII